MKVYVHTDIEGVAGWAFYASWSNSLLNRDHLRRMNQLFTDEISAACRAALDTGADDVWVNDSHGPCYNIFFEQLPKECQVIHGRPQYFDALLPCFDATVDALVCIGMHAMAGTPRSVCPHSLWHVNGDDVQLSECTMAAALAGYHDVPCVCVSGDDKLCAEVRQKLPRTETVTVKWGIASQNARSLTPTRACELIYDGVRRGLERRDEIRPYKIPGPYRINVSDRDPTEMMREEDVCGDDFWETVHRARIQGGYWRFGDPIDDRVFRWPDSLFKGDA